MVVTSTKGNPVDVSLWRATAAWGEGTSDSAAPGRQRRARHGGRRDVDAARVARHVLDHARRRHGRLRVRDVADRDAARALLLRAHGRDDVQRAELAGHARHELRLADPRRRAAGLAERAPLGLARERERRPSGPSLTIIFTRPAAPPPPVALDDVPALSPRALAALAAALAGLGALALQKDARRPPGRSRGPRGCPRRPRCRPRRARGPA